MAKKIFRIHESGITSESGWFNSTAITSKQLDSIITDGKGIATSIPSPFARIDLVKSAFKWVTNNGLDGNTASHKLVSDALDVGQLFFLSNMYPELEIIEWNPKERLDALEGSQHKQFAQTLKTFWEQDKEVYNFGKVNRLFFILYNKQLIGGTSPASLFFSQPDANAEKLNMNIVRGSDKLLDNEYASLAQREWVFIEYIFALSKTSEFKSGFTNPGQDEVHQYLEKVKESLTHEQRLIIDNMTEQHAVSYNRCHVYDSAANYCEVLGVPLGLINRDTSSIAIESDFVIDSKLCEEKPLVLPYDKFSSSWVYTTKDVKWNGELMRDKILYRNDQVDVESMLPVQNDKYPWLTIGNFLEDYIIELPYTIDAEKFELCGSNNHLLPLTPTFFKFFPTSDLPDLVKMAQLSGGGVEVKLNIPVKGEKPISYKKIYGADDVKKLKIHVAIFPFVKIHKTPVRNNIGILDGDVDNNQKNKVTIDLFFDGINVDSPKSCIRSSGLSKTVKSEYISTEKAFDSIQLKVNNVRGYVVPRMLEYSPSTSGIDYSIDFGTTNTHIEYKHKSSAEKALENESPLNIWASLYDRNGNDFTEREFKVNEGTFDHEILPHVFGNNEISFPVRTALVENSDIDFNQRVEVFKHINNFLLFEKKTSLTHLKLHTDIKWSNYSLDEDKKRVEAYLENLVTIVFYKTLLSQGNLNSTSITWFYPISMTKFQQGVLEGLWLKVYKKVFGLFAKDENLRKMPESIAPFYYYHKKKAVHGLSVSIDVGGGSSDISIFDNGRAETISSFKFAGNAIFGDGYGGSPSVNGFVNAFKGAADNYLKSNEKEKYLILNNILDVRERSSDFSSFLFSLNKSSGQDFDYAEIIKNEMNLKICVLIFYSAIGFYVAKVLKGEGYSVPKNYLFSGTGAKTISIIDNSQTLENISSLFLFLTESVMDKKSVEKVETILSPIPKEITCKGGLLNNLPYTGSMKFWTGGTSNSDLDRLIDASDERDVPKYNDLTNELKDSVILSIKEFYSLLDLFFEQNKIDDVFGIQRDAYSIFQKMREEQLQQFLDEGIRAKIQGYGSNLNAPIEETLFFYPLIGMMNKLAFELSKNRQT